MLNFKRITAAVMALTLSTTFAANLVFAEDETKEAHVMLGNDVTGSGLSIKKGPTNQSSRITVVEKDGVTGWCVDPYRNIYSTADDANQAIYVDIDRNIAYNVKDYKNYAVTVKYYDEGYGHFRIQYDGQMAPWEGSGGSPKTCKTEVVYLNDTREWVEYTFILDAPKFNGNISSGSDFVITLHEYSMSMSLEPITFSEIKVAPVETAASVRAHMFTEEMGNNFFKETPVKINADIYNSSSSTQKVNAEFTSVNFLGEESYSETFELEVPAAGNVRQVIEFTPEFSTYTGWLTIKGDGIYSKSFIEYSYTYSTEKNNQLFAVNNHLHRLWTQRDASIAVPLMDKVGISANRDGIWMNMVYPATEPTFTMPTSSKNVFELQKEYNIDWMEILVAQDLTWTAGLDVGSDSFKKGYEIYLNDIVPAIKDYTEYYEVMNEVNSHYSAEWYAEMVNLSWDVVKKYHPEGKLVVGGTSGTPISWLDTLLDLIGDHLDLLSIHPYGMTTSPMSSKRYEAILSVRDLLDRKGYEDIPLSITEMGWSTGWVGYEKQPAFTAQIYAICSKPELMVDQIYYYDFIDDGYWLDDQENNFGFIRTYNTVIDTPYTAKPNYVATGWLNENLTDAVLVKDEMTDTHGIYQYKTPENKDVMLVWSELDNEYFSFDLGSDDVEAYDMFGNPLNYHVENGKIGFSTNFNVVYLVGDFEEYELIDNGNFEINNVAFEMPYDDIIDVEITKNIPENATIEVELPERAEFDVYENNGFIGNKAVVRLHGQGITGHSDKAKIYIKGDNGEELLRTDVVLNYTDKLDVSFNTDLYGKNLKRWVGKMKIKNNGHVEPISGKIVFNSPTEFNEKLKSVKIPEIAPDTEQEIVFNLPEVQYCTSYYIDMDIVLDDGYVQNFSIYSDCCVALYAHNKPTIDGYIEDGEWNNDIHLILDENNVYTDNASVGSYNGNADLSADMIFEWDEQYMYMAAKVRDDVFYQTQSGSGIWSCDSIQVGFTWTGVVDPTNTLHTEIGWALTPENGSHQEIWSTESNVSGFDEDCLYAVRREGEYTYYEVRIPWKGLVSDEAVIENGSAMRFNMLVNDNDGNGRYGWVEYGTGFGVYKNASEFGYMRLLDNKAN